MLKRIYQPFELISLLRVIRLLRFPISWHIDSQQSIFIQQTAPKLMFENIRIQIATMHQQNCLVGRSFVIVNDTNIGAIKILDKIGFHGLSFVLLAVIRVKSDDNKMCYPLTLKVLLFSFGNSP